MPPMKGRPVRSSPLDDPLLRGYRRQARLVAGSIVEDFIAPDLVKRIRAVPKRLEWEVQSTIGSGGFGTVVLQREKATGSVRAVKQIPTGSPVVAHFVRQEIANLITLMPYSSLHFVKLFAWYTLSSQTCIVMEYFSHGDLAQWADSGFTSEQEKVSIVHQIAEAIEHMQAHFIVHRDIKPSNIFVVSPEPHWWVKLGDFGTSKTTNCAVKYLDDFPIDGNEGFTAPELLEPGKWKHSIHSSSDIWSLGVLAFWLCTGHDGTLPLNYLYETGAQTLDEFFNQGQDTSSDKISFFKGTMRVDPSERLEVEKIKGHAWLRGPFSNQYRSIWEHLNRNSCDSISSPSPDPDLQIWTTCDGEPQRVTQTGTSQSIYLQPGRPIQSQANTSSAEISSPQTTLAQNQAPRDEVQICVTPTDPPSSAINSSTVQNHKEATTCIPEESALHATPEGEPRAVGSGHPESQRSNFSAGSSNPRKRKRPETGFTRLGRTYTTTNIRGRGMTLLGDVYVNTLSDLKSLYNGRRNTTIGNPSNASKDMRTWAPPRPARELEKWFASSSSNTANEAPEIT